MRILRVLLVLAVVAGLGWYLLREAPRDEAAPAPDDPVSVTEPVPDTTPVSSTLHAAVGLLAVEREDREAYQRSYFGKGWIDADDNCRDTRQEVLARDSLVGVGSGCRIFKGRWHSADDDRYWTESHQVQIDHLVPLAEAWDSGAYRWTAATRLRYANDLGDRRALVPLSGSVNDDKGADDPTWYLPKAGICSYVTSWIAVKLRWNLSVDERELTALRKAVAACPDEPLKVTRAGLDLLSFAAGTGTTSADVVIDSIRPGEGEQVVLRNRGEVEVRLVGWQVRDDIGYGRYRIPDLVLGPGRTLTIKSSSGKDGNATDLVRHAAWGDVWNKGGDTAVLIDGSASVTDTCAYREAAATVRC